MPTPTITSVTPATIPAGAGLTTITIGGTNFLTGPTVVIGDLPVSAVVESGGNSITCKVSVPGNHARGALDVTVTNTDAGTVTDAAALSVVSPAVQANSQQYGYANSLAGVTPGTNAVGVVDPSVVVESGSLSAPAARPYVDAVSNNASGRGTPGMDVLNPAYSVAHENATAVSGLSSDGATVFSVNPQQNQFDGQTMISPTQAGLLPPGDRSGDNPSADEDTRDEGFQVGDEHTAQLPLAPTMGSVSSPSAGQATVNWTAPTDPDGYGITGYEIVATSSDGGTSPLTYEVGNVLTSTVSGLTSSKHYTFTVAAKNIAGTGAQSAASGSLAIT